MATSKNLYTVHRPWVNGKNDPMVGSAPITRKTPKTYIVESTPASNYCGTIRVSEVDCGRFFFTTPELVIRDAQDKAQKVANEAAVEFDKMLALTWEKEDD